MRREGFLMSSDFSDLSRRLTAALRLRAAPVAIRFTATPATEPRVESTAPPANEAGPITKEGA